MIQRVFFSGLIMGTLSLTAGCGQEENTNQVEQTKVHYQCPMKCEGDKVYLEATSCPVCNMDLKEVAQS